MPRNRRKLRQAYLSRLFEGEETSPEIQELIKKALVLRNKGKRGKRMGEDILAARKQANRKLAKGKS